MVVLETTYLGLYHLKNEFEETYTEAKNHKINLGNRKFNFRKIYLDCLGSYATCLVRHLMPMMTESSSEGSFGQTCPDFLPVGQAESTKII